MSKYAKFSKEELLALVEKQDNELASKKYGLVWDSEREPEQVVLDCESNLPILKRVKGKEIKTDKDEDNILIEGDNYHALTVLNYTHQEKIDVIYIDPPYNTGNQDFKYNDRFVDREDGFRHSKWLNFMEKRLFLSKNLLTESGIIFISIDDNEMAQLRLLSDKVFGENNFVGIFPWKKRTIKSDVPFGVSQDYEWVISFCRPNFRAGLLHERKYHQSEDYPNDRWRLADLTTQKIEADRPNSAFDLVDPRTGKTYPYNPNRLWGITKDTFKEYYRKGKIVFPGDYDFLKIKIPAYRVFESEDISKSLKKYGTKDAVKSVSTFLPQEVGMNEDGNKEIVSMFGQKIFSYPKPMSLIKYFLSFGNNKDVTVLDFMAGSGTTGHAVLELNKEDGGNRKFILCTNNELNGFEKELEEKGLSEKEIEKYGICQRVTYPRLEKVIKGYKKSDDGEKVSGLGGNLQYFRTALIKDTKNKDQMRVDLTEKCTEMLCVKENIFNLEKETEDYKIFSSNKGDRFLCVYYNLYDDSFQGFLKEINKLNGKKKIYMFSMDGKVSKALFVGVRNFEIEEIPQKIIDIYKQLIKMNIPVKADIIFLEFDKANKKVFENKDKDEGARSLRIVLEKTIQKIAQKNGVSIIRENSKEEKIAVLNDTLKSNKVFTQVQWEENKTYLVIGNHASHGEYSEYDLRQVEQFYRHIQTLLNVFNI